MRITLAPVVFGVTDGMTCALGVIFSLNGHTSLILPTAVAVGAAECVGMAAGEWLSESDNGFGESAAIGLASGAAGVIPALPYVFLAGAWAITLSVFLLVVLAGVVTVARAAKRGAGRALIETYGVLVAVAIVVWLSQVVTPQGR